MKVKIHLNILFAVALATAALAVTANAAPRPNLAVQPWVAPSSVLVNSTYQYTARVKNIGNQTAQNVVLTITFPLTNTSPTRYIMGKVTAFPSNCSITSNKLVCSLGNIGTSNNSNLRQVSFNFEYPVTTQALSLLATATTSSQNEQNANNNFLSVAPNVAHQSMPLTSADVVVSHCTGTNLTSYFECEQAPSSISSFPMQLAPGGTIVPPAPGYFGTWSQPSNEELQFNISDGYSGATFNGFVANGNCFDGIATFTPASSYNSAYRVCVQ